MSFNNNTQGPVGAIKHNDDRRAAIPTTELAGEESMAAEEMSTEGRYRTFKNEFNRGRDPELYWLGKYQNDSEETQSPDLRIDTRSIATKRFALKCSSISSTPFVRIRAQRCRCRFSATNCLQYLTTNWSASHLTTSTMPIGATALSKATRCS